MMIGRKELLDRIRRHPLMRALRVDKLTCAALEATLVEYASGRAAQTIPVQRMLTTGEDAIRARAEALARVIGPLTDWHRDPRPGAAADGAGSEPWHGRATGVSELENPVRAP